VTVDKPQQRGPERALLDLSLHASTLAASPAGVSTGPAIHPVMHAGGRQRGGRFAWPEHLAGRGAAAVGGSEVVKRVQINDGEGRAIA